MLSACYLQNINPAEEIIAVNQAFAVPLVDQYGTVLSKPLIGEFDVVVRNTGQKTIVDWKTAGARWPKGKPHRALQPTVYLYAATSMTNGSRPDFRFDIVVKNKTPVFEQHVTKRNVDQMNRMVELVKMAESMIAAEHFYPNQEGMFCKNCPFQTACKSWHRDRMRLTSTAKVAA
jgi:CRISPR/Cas system-associated exonuclease Cas4 (RecB family)